APSGCLDELVHLRQGRANLVLAVDYLDEDGKVLRQPENLRRVDAARGAEALDAAPDRRARETQLARLPHDDVVERMTVQRVRLADEDTEELPVARDFHAVLPTVYPTQTAT